MDLIERYLGAVSNYLPAKQRNDILAELRSSIYDSLERNDQALDDQAAVVAALQALGEPAKVAAAYGNNRQYLISPALFPQFRSVVLLVFSIMIATQLGLALLGSLGNQRLNIINTIWGVIGNLPATFGLIVAIFWGLQQLEVEAEFEPKKPFDPRKLPAITPASEKVGRGSQLFGIAAQVILLGWLMQFQAEGGFRWFSGQGFFENPVISQYFTLVVVASIVNIVVDLVVLWRGVWQTSTRIASLAASGLSLIVLFLLIQGHSAWLANAGYPRSLIQLSKLGDMIRESNMAIGMSAFYYGLTFTALFVIVDAGYTAYKLYQERSHAQQNEVVVTA
ncbi:HAAS signaling domain-containing protein [Herpetosiphon sp. NSE202]|uniref:HAAS signaling domain-containing protein n=1 Tax=Herpetosiphon sp. NSE202 TaxID=3351349 RepID=UPI00362D167F